MAMIGSRRNPRATVPRTDAQQPPHKLIIAVDFGTTFSSVAYAHTQYPQNQTILSEWGRGRTGQEVPSVLKKIKNHPDTYKWGFEALQNLTSGEKVYEWFKLGLCPELKDRFEAESDFAARYPSKTALTATAAECQGLVTVYLQFLREAASSFIDRIDPTVADTPKEYIITVPAIWTDRAQDLTRLCAQEAGMGTHETLNIIAEPEAAGLFALHEISKGKVAVGDAFVICDAGGGTVDLSSYRIKSLNPMRLDKSAHDKGGLCGSSFLDRIFADELQKMFGFRDSDRKRMKWLKKTVTHFQRDIKPYFSGDDLAEASYNIDVVGQNFDASYHNISGDDLVLSTQFICEQVFNPVIDKIGKLVLAQVQATDNVKQVLLVGGFGNNPYLQKRLQDILPYNVSLRLVKDGNSAIVRGALMAGLSDILVPRPVEAQRRPKSQRATKDDGSIGARVVSRLASKHYGVTAYVPYNPDEHNDGKHRMAYRSVYDRNEIEVMQWFVSKEEVIEEGEPKSFSLYYAKNTQSGPPKTIKCTVFASTSKIPPKYPSTSEYPDPDVEKLLVLEMSLDEIDFPVQERKTGSYYIIDFDVEMRLYSANLSFVLISGETRYEPKKVVFM